MANLRFIKSLNERYKKESKFKNMDFNFVNENLTEQVKRVTFSKKIEENLGDPFKKYLVDNEKTNVYLLFIDICNFSTRFQNYSNRQLCDLLDQYYDIVIPIIYEHGGEIDKIIGDGIICIFGEPFTQGDLQSKVNDCAKKLISRTNGTRFSSKVAVHDGEVIYYHNKSIYYEEFTIIGKVITEIHRLESISDDEKINFYRNSGYDNFIMHRIGNRPQNVNQQIQAQWHVRGPFLIDPPLRGVPGFNAKKTMEKR
jgi:hypothetical protein